MANQDYDFELTDDDEALIDLFNAGAFLNHLNSRCLRTCSDQLDEARADFARGDRRSMERSMAICARMLRAGLDLAERQQ